MKYLRNYLNLLALFVIVTMHTYGNSMNPSVEGVDDVEVYLFLRSNAKNDFKNLKFGDIIAFISNLTGQKVCHRVVGISPSGIVRTRGDNNRLIDPEIINFQEDAIGKIIKGLK